MRSIKLFCFPYAGGSAAVYKNWQKHLSPNIEIVPVELKGRGRRISEPLYKNVDDLVDDLFPLIQKECQRNYYAFFGHSMGAMIAYELSLRINQSPVALPIRLFLSGRGAPHIASSKNYHLLDDEAFKAEILNLGGTPPEFFEHQELIDIFLPVLKNDFKLVETSGREEIMPLNAPITSFFGEDEDLTTEQKEGWEYYTEKKFKKYVYQGGHFFIKEHYKTIIDILNKQLQEDLESLNNSMWL
ncbi:thioesterase II family protein [Fulvivirga sediminis]|uniref:Thioesterase n=1 Tax=Fulvivirga sediminis TaxID=2803949 RepID=A0A937F3B4_9BACT|nr:thioesterase [Fulvivirga sediminis]MBL3655562.1 thioesterase [Fulvivirga sediminis]